MAIQRVSAGPHVLDALNEAVTFGPGFINLDLSDVDNVHFAVTAPTSTLTCQLQASTDGITWSPRSFTRGKSAFGPTFTLAAATLEDVCTFGSNNLPYVRFIVTEYTSGSITFSGVIGARIFTR